MFARGRGCRRCGRGTGWSASRLIRWRKSRFALTSAGNLSRASRRAAADAGPKYTCPIPPAPSRRTTVYPANAFAEAIPLRHVSMLLTPALRQPDNRGEQRHFGWPAQEGGRRRNAVATRWSRRSALSPWPCTSGRWRRWWPTWRSSWRRSTTPRWSRISRRPAISGARCRSDDHVEVALIVMFMAEGETRRRPWPGTPPSPR